MDELRVGLPVEHLGPDENNSWDTGGKTLYRGHPGRIYDPTWVHVRVNWVGLEDETASRNTGHNPDLETNTEFLGLGLLSEEEYERRAARIAAGETPL